MTSQSSPNIRTLRPKTISKLDLPLMISLKLLSSPSKQNLWSMCASMPQMIRLASFNNLASSLPWCILHVESSKVGKEILNLECAILPLGNNKEAMSLEATTRTIFLSVLNEFASVFQMKVFPIPPYPYRKNIPPSFLLIAWIILLKIDVCWSTVLERHFKSDESKVNFELFQLKQ